CGCIVSGGGACFLGPETLEDALRSGCKLLARNVCHGSTRNCYSYTAPGEGGEGAMRSMKQALEDASLEPTEIDYINAHGTSTDLNDPYETTAIKNVFGNHAKTLAVSSTKSMTGHLLGAAGGVEAVISVKSIMDNIIPATINYETEDPDCDLDYVPNEARKQQVKAVVSNSLGFGGHNASLVFKEY